ncbi:filamentous haemagglutinin family protein [Sphingobium baderi]|uniref:Filamentous haemagglutinin FhaB/tRNA nuclease CdiA-like TPS domain-containing protein n=1 Tax=Sphingobium baderi TaxID=1332080 RepID=A0A0S3EZP3_9SPHN|nr:filamentous haemagglutinin family protein [Sphingobium baderi]ALR20902.1 hypothetical protein ATN00_11935 [Sphingobium baderi]
MTTNSSFRRKLLIGASLSAMLMTGVAEARSGRVFSGRGGADPAAAAARAAQAEAVRATQTNSASKRAIETFRRAAETRRAAMDAQVQARAAAMAAQNMIANGLKPGGLQIANGVDLDPSLWVGANGPIESAGEDGRTNVTVEQTEQKAILNWDSFNVGRETDLAFQQGGSDWVVLNRVHDASASQIHGSITAPGTVLILNQNGVLFGGTSTVNVRNLVAAAALMTDTQFNEYGIYYSGTTGANASLRFNSSFTDALGAIKVEAGAQINTIKPASVVEGGGYVLLMGAETVNEGTITTPRGQALLAAGGEFAVRAGQGTDANLWATTRGNELSVNADGGTVTNRGIIEAAEGDITLVGKHVVQNGVAVATTTVAARGSVHLLTDLSDSEASVTLTGNSLTLVVPDYDSETTATDAQRNAMTNEQVGVDVDGRGWNNKAIGNLVYTLPDRKDLSRIDIRTGGTVTFEGDSQTIATGGQMAITALKRVFVEDGALLDVSGSQGVALSMESNSLLVNIQPYEMRDSALNRENENLKSTDIWVDVRSLVLMPDGTGGHDGDRYYTGNGFLEVGGHLGNVERGIGEWTAQGGNITIYSDEIVAQKGAIFDISGGSIDYQAGLIRSTRVMGADGKLYDIANAPAGMEMVAWGDAFVRKHERWGDAYTQVWSNPLFSSRGISRWEEGYTVGRDAGVLTLRAPTVVFEGEIVADVIAGDRQTAERPGYPKPVEQNMLPDRVDGYKVPQDVAPLAGQLYVGVGGFKGVLSSLDQNAIPFESTVVIGAGSDVAGSLDSHTALSDDLVNRIEFSAADLNRFGLGDLRVLTSDSITIAESLTLQDGGQLRLRGQDINVQGNVTARSGLIALFGTQDGSIGSESASSVIIGEGVALDTSGLWVNLPDGGNAADVAHIAGGDIHIASNQGDIVLGAGSLLDASAGGAILIDGEMRGADGGDVTLSVASTPVGSHNRVQMDGTIRSYGSEDGVGGTLTLATNDAVVIGGSMLAENGVLGAGERAPFALALTEDTVLPAGLELPTDVTVTKMRVGPGEITTEITRVSIFHMNPGSFLIPEGGWTVPTGVTVYGHNQLSYRAGTFIEANTDVRQISGTIPIGTPLPELLYPTGLALTTPVSTTYAAGTILAEDLTVPAGTAIERGNALGVAAKVRETVLTQDFFQQGFSQYDVRSFGDIAVADGATIEVAAPVRRFTADSADVASGAAPGEALELWLPEMFREDMANGRFIQRTGAGISLTASNQRTGSNPPPPAGALYVGRDSTLRVDDGQSIALHSYTSMLVEGRLEAHGGALSLEALGAPPAVGDNHASYDPTQSLWIADGAVLDVSGRAQTASDRFGRRYADVSAGGAVQLAANGHAFLITRPGALIDISGAAAQIDYAVAGVLGGSGTADVATNGGSLELTSARAIVLDAELRAAGGGEGAIGGLLSIDQRALGLTFGPQLPTYPLPDYLRELSKTVLDVSHVATDMGEIDFGDCIAACWTPGQTLAEADAANEGTPDILLLARIGADKIEDSGFDSLTLRAQDVVLINGAVDLTLAGTLTLDGAIGAADGDLRGALPGEDDLSGATNADNDSILRAGYVRMDGSGARPSSLQLHPVRESGKSALEGDWPSIGKGTLTIEGSLIDAGHARFGANGEIFRNNAQMLPFEYASWKDVHLSSSGDIRLTGGRIGTSGDLTLTAAQVYPLTDATAALYAGRLEYVRPNQTAPYQSILPGSTLTINGIEGVTPAAPLSLYGQLTLSADIIEQGGNIRAPLGKIVLGSGAHNQFNAPLPVPNENGDGYTYNGPYVSTSEVNLLPGSVTSVSAADLVIPYGGTVDGLTWVRRDVNDLPAEDGEMDTTLAHQGIAIIGSLRADEGSTLDLSGGGTVAGAGFIPGRGGSIDVLSNPFYNISPAYRDLSSPGNKVYALVPSYGASTAPVAEAGRNQPGVGQQIVVPNGVAGLPAGTYTLLPGEYALMEGAFRVELGAAIKPGAAVSQLADGSFFAAVNSANALTGERNGQPLSAILTPAEVVKTYTEYNQTDLATYFAQAPRGALFDHPMPALPQDGKQLLLAVTPQKEDSDRLVLSFNGTGLFGAGEGGRGGSLAVVKGVASNAFNGGLEIVADGAVASEGFIALNASDLNAIGATLVTIGGEMEPLSALQPQIMNIRAGGGSLPLFLATGTLSSYIVDSSGFTTVALRDGAVLEAPQVMLIAGANNHVVVEDGARISSIGQGEPAYDAASGYVAQTGANVLAVSNGLLDLSVTAVTATAGTIRVEDGAQLHSDGTLAFVSNGAVELSGEADYGGRYVSLSTGSFNIGESDALADAEADGIMPFGISLNQNVLTRLMEGSSTSGVPAVERLILTASQQINFYGSVDLDTGNGSGEEALQLVLNAPALYGHGGDGDAVSISAGTLVWNGIVTQAGNGASANYGSIQPGAPILNGPGHGSGTLNLIADTILLGYQDGSAVYHDETLDRLALGFSTVNLVAADRIVTGEKGSLSVWQSQAVYGEAGTGGTLNLVAPVVTGKAGSVFDYRTGGALTLSAPEGGTAESAEAALGGEIRLTGASIAADTHVALPSGRLVMTATQGDIVLGDGAVIDMAGRPTEFFDQTRYSWGGDVVLESAHGDVSLAQGASIAIGAQHNHAGTLKVTAVEGTVTLDGAITGHATGADDEADPELRNGSIDIRAGTIADFAGLNTGLTESGVTDSRSFIVKTGDLAIGDEIVARNVTISADGGSLTVNGRIDASGAKPGTIRLSARDDLTLAGSAVLDASASELWVDSYGAPVEAQNRGLVELTSAGGTLALQQGATIDLSSADDVARGRIELNAQRRGSNDVAIAAAQAVNISGADSIAVNAFRSYEPAGGVINQALMDGIHADSDAFINAAIGNAALLGRMAGLRAYADAFHLRPGVELVSAAGESLSVSGDLNLAGYRYASLNVDTQRTAVYGSGEAGVLLVRAADDLNIFGSITDGFAEPARTPDDNGWVLYAGGQNATSNAWPADYHVPRAMRLGAGAVLPLGAVLGYDIEVNGFNVVANRVIGAESRLNTALTLNREWVLTAPVTLPDGTIHARGAILPAGTLLPADTVLGTGTVLPQQVSLQAMTWPAGAELPAMLTLSGPAQLQAGDIIPRNSNVALDRISGLLAAPLTLDSELTLAGGTSGVVSSFANRGTLDFDIEIRRSSRLWRDVVIPFEFVSSISMSKPSWMADGWVATANIWNAQGTLLYRPGDLITLNIPSGSRFGAGTVLPRQNAGSPGTMNIESMTLPAGTPLDVFSEAINLNAPVTVAAGTVLPAGTTVRQIGGASMRPTLPDGTQGRIWAVAPMLPQGSESWSMRLVAGADIASADGRTLSSETALAEQGLSGDLLLSDRHYVNPNAETDFGISPTWALALNRMQNFSVIRTGTGSLDLLAGGGYQQSSLYGIYTAGTPTADIGGLTPDGYNEFNQPRATLNGGDPANPWLGDAAFAGYRTAMEDYRAWYPEHGGDLLLAVQGDIRSYTTTRTSAYMRVGSAAMGNWLWRQGAYSQADIMGGADTPTAWWINFGGYVANNPYANSATAPNNQNGPLLEGFMGIGTLGGGNLTVTAGGNAGVMENWATTATGTNDNGLGAIASSGLNLSVGGTGRVTQVTMVEGRVTGGTLVQTGGGDMIVKIGGGLNPGSGTNHAGDLNGTFVNLRGDIDIAAGSIGVIQPYILTTTIDPRVPDPLHPANAYSRGGIGLAPGDGHVSVNTRGDMVIAGVVDPGRVGQSANAGVSFGRFVPPTTLVPTLVWSNNNSGWGTAGQPVEEWALDPGFPVCDLYPGACVMGTIETFDPDGDPTFGRVAGDILRTGFSLWREDTSISLFSAGGDLTPLVYDNTANVSTRNISKMDDGRYWFPGTLSVIAAHGDLFVDVGSCSASSSSCSSGPTGSGLPVLELAPSPNGSLEFLIGGSIRGAGTEQNIHASGLAVGMSGMALNPNDVPNPFRPNWESHYVRTWGAPANHGLPTLFNAPGTAANSLVAFQRDTALGRLYDGQRDPMRFYAVDGDISNFSVGFMGWQDMMPHYIGAGPAEIRAGRDIVNFGSNPQLGCGYGGPASCRTTPNYYLTGVGMIRGLVVHNDPRDISIMSAGRDIIYSSMNVAGAGNLVIEAGRDIYQADRGMFKSVGPLFDLSPETRNGGAAITVLTGVGAGGPDYARFLDLYLNPENLADAGRGLGEQNVVNDEGFVEDVQKVAKNYGEELAAWLEARFGYEATDAEDARAFFATRTEQEQAIFAREVYFDELKIGGREYSGKIESGRLSSYLRSRLAIAALFPETDADGNAISYGGNLTMFGASGTRTEFGGDVEILVAGGQTTLGVGGIAPPSTAGVLSMGSGNIDIYSLGSILLGKSRVFTTFGGDLLMWSAQGDINAGRGAKSTVVYQPPRRVYDTFGNVTLSPPTQNTGAGIATLAPIPEIPPGDIDLIAPLGVIDAGEAGIRVSGDINLAALQILNAANIKVEGEATGIPVVVAVNTGALTSASSAASAVANQAADLAERARPQMRTEIPTILNVRFLGFGE